MRRQIVALTVLAAILAAALSAVPLAIGAAQYFLDDKQLVLQHVADAAAVAVAVDLTRGQTPHDLPGAATATIGLYTPDGQLLAGDGPQSAEPVVRRAAGGETTHAEDIDGQLVIAVPVTDRNGTAAGRIVTGIVRVANDYADVRWRIVGTWAAMLGLCAAAVTVTWLIARRLARRLAAPLESLSQAAHRLGRGDFTIRAQPSGIPEIDSAGASLNITAERLGTLIARERAFSAHTSHQLRTPLAGLRLELEAALAAPRTDLRTAVAGALRSADRLEQTIDELLTLARDPLPQTDLLAVPDLLEELTATWRPILVAQHRNLVVSVAPDIPDSRASSAALRQAVGVLLENAATHGAGTVTLTVRDAAGALAFDVSDEGDGFPDDEPLHRPRTSAPGRGIGLPLARTLIEAEGGRLLLSHSAPPTLTIYLLADPPGSGA